MHCPSCGSELPPVEVNFCPGCGRPLYEPGPSSRSRRGLIAACLAVVALVSAGGAGLLLADRQGPTDRRLAATGAANPSTEPSPTTAPSPSAAATPSPTPVPTAFTAAELAQEYGPGVLRVEVEGCGQSGSGTGFAIGPNHVVTNHHVVNIDPSPELVDRDGSRWQGRVIGWRQSPDVAVIEVDRRLPIWLPWADTGDLTEGQSLVALGYPVPELDFSVTQADIVSFQTTDGVRRAVRTDGAVDRGNSGGPALTARGEVAGVVTEMEANDGGLQLVALLYTADALAHEVDAIMASPALVEPACDSGRETLPDEWSDDEDARESEEPYSYGDDPALDALEDACADGDMAACDELYTESPYGSAYEEFAETCGGRGEPVSGTCVSEVAPSPTAPPEDAGLAGLREACAGGDDASCDELYQEAPIGSEDEFFGSTCGGRLEPTEGACSQEPA